MAVAAGTDFAVKTGFGIDVSVGRGACAVTTDADGFDGVLSNVGFAGGTIAGASLGFEASLLSILGDAGGPVHATITKTIAPTAMPVIETLFKSLMQATV